MNSDLLVLLVAAVFISILLYLALRRPLRDLLLDTLKIPAAARFYLRVLLFVLLLIAFSCTIKQTVKAADTFMEAVWSFAGYMQDYATGLIILLLIYTLIITILVAVLRRRNEQ